MRINDVNLLRQVVNYLHNHREAVRIKKMLYCLCTNRWEKDIDYLNSINSQYLIEQIVREYDTLDRLKFLLQRLIKTVNKPKQYTEIAKIVYLAIGQLYPEFQQEHGSRSPQLRQTQPVAEPQPHPHAQVASEPASAGNNVPSAIYRAYAPAPTQVSDGKTVASALYRAYAPAPTQPDLVPEPIPTPDDSQYADETYYEEEVPEGIPIEPYVVPPYDPFVLRQNVMSYSNPLRAKIIMVLMLRPHLDVGNQLTAAMRDYHLDDLLLEVLKTFPTTASLEESMTAAIEQLIEVEEYGKTATGLLQSLIPLYRPVREDPLRSVAE